jgi:hypothetical protein
MGIAFNRHLSEGVYSNSLPRINAFFIIMDEIWKPIPWYEWHYQISSLWNVKSLRRIESSKNNSTRNRNEKILKPSKWSTGYMQVSLSMNWVSKNYTIHRLFATAFIPNLENKPQVNHKDSNRSNNWINNLEWVTPSENILHAVIVGNLFISQERRNLQKKKVWQYTREWVFIRNWDWVIDASKALWINKHNLANCCRWLSKACWWFWWRYI